MALPLMLLLAALPLAHIAGAQTDQSALDLAAELTVEEKQVKSEPIRRNFRRPEIYVTCFLLPVASFRQQQ